METLTMEDGWAWCYHSEEDPPDVHGFPEQHDVVLDPMRDWCVTHVPHTPCTCGKFALAWPAEAAV
jgi:hypothetical protein